MYIFFHSSISLEILKLILYITKRFFPFNHVINSRIKKKYEARAICSSRRRLKTRTSTTLRFTFVVLKERKKKKSKRYISRFVFESLSFYFPLVLAIHLETHGDRRLRDEKKKINPLWNRGGAMVDVPEAAAGSVTGHGAGEWRVEKKKITGRGREGGVWKRYALETGGSYVLLGHYVRRGTKVYPEGLWRWPKGEEGIPLLFFFFSPSLSPSKLSPNGSDGIKRVRYRSIILND